MAVATDPMVKLARDLEKLRKENAQLRTMNKKLLVRGAGYDDFLDEYRQIVEKDNFSFTGQPVYKKQQPFDPAHSEIACVMVSDLHLSEVVDFEESNGINVYNSVIAASRLWEYAQKVKSILSRHRTMYTIENIWSPLLGDIINGSIHPEMIISNDLSDPAAVVLASRLLEMFYIEIASIGLRIEIDAIHGNHPRLTAKMPTKKQAHTNLDWLIYQQLEDKLSRNDQFNMKVHQSQIGLRKLFKWNYVFEHGISVASGKEEDFEDRVRAMFDDPVYRQATGYTGPSFDQIVIGNMHKPKFLERTIINGSFTGQNELGQSWRLKPIRATQLMWGVSKRHVKTWQYMIDLSHVRSEKHKNPFAEYAAWYMKKHAR
jgi:hypothetical protein